MSNLSDKEIDRLSREASDSYEPDDSSLSWSRLEQKLDQMMPERPPDRFNFGRTNPYVWGPAIILLAGASFFIHKTIHYSHLSTPNTQTANPSASIPDANSQNKKGNTIHLDSAAVNLNGAKEENIQLSEMDQKQAGSANSGIDAAAGKLSGPASNNSYLNPNAVSGYKQTDRRTSSNASEPGATAAAGSFETGHAVSGEQQNAPETNGLAGKNGAAVIAGNMQNKNQIHLPVVITYGTGLGKVTGNDSLMNQLAQSNTPIYKKSLHLNRSLNIGFTFGPDYTNAGGITNNQIGNYIGLTLGYYLTDKISLNTGFIYTNKFYWSQAHNYFFRQPANITPTVYARSLAAPPPIDYINGASNIWELPLTLRYDFAHHNKTRFFANAGLSSYFMMKQTYIYFLHSNQNQLAYKISDNQQVNYWFGIADISAGFEAEIGKGFSFQAEPFLKLPLRDMGMENLKLTSYGFLMTFKYAPVIGRSKK